MANDKKRTDDRVTVVIPKPDNVTGDTETTVAVNGVLYQIQYDRPVEVPRNVAEVIAQSQKLKREIAEAVDAAKLRPGKAAIAEL